MAACEKEQGIPEGAILLTTEGFHSDNSKTSVDGTTVQWVGGETVNINNSNYTVNVSGSQAYVDGSAINPVNNSVYAYYGCEVTSGRLSSSPTVTVPDSYTSSYEGGRQILPLPMVAFSSPMGNAIKFQHITAAVNVKVRNEISGATLVLDRVTVSSTAYKLSGTVTLTHGQPPVVPTQAGSSNTVTVELSGSPTIAYNSVLDVQVPILPIGSNGKMTVEVYCHDNATNNHYTFSKEIDAIALGHNVMLTAGCRISTETGNVDVEHVVDLSSCGGDYAAQDGDVLTGTLSEHKVTVAAGATITLSNANITANYGNAAVECLGNATIIIEGYTNAVTGGTDGAGIHIPSGYTLTIRGNGHLTATGNSGAGIGGNYDENCGNIIIEDAEITATSDYACGIGGCPSYSCGDITISGATITATTDFLNAAIGSGQGDEYYGPASCGNITITNSTITATGGEDAAAIGSGAGYGWNDVSLSGFSTCGTITISGSTCRLSLDDRGQAEYTVGPGYGGVCGTVTINGSTGYYTEERIYP